MFQRENFSFYDKVLLHSITSEIILGDWRNTYAGLSENLEMWLPYTFASWTAKQGCRIYVCIIFCKFKCLSKLSRMPSTGLCNQIQPNKTSLLCLKTKLLFRGSLLKVYISISSTMYGLFTKSVINEDNINIERTNCQRDCANGRQTCD